LGIRWDHDPLEIVQWVDDERLREFENNVYEQGFIPNGAGF
jgi:alpha 1,2-mannosyltransferase